VREGSGLERVKRDVGAHVFSNLFIDLTHSVMIFGGQVSVRGEAATAQKLIEAVGDADEGVREAAARSLTLVASADAMGQVWQRGGGEGASVRAARAHTHRQTHTHTHTHTHTGA